MYSRDNEDEVILNLINQHPDIEKICVDIGAQTLRNNNIANLVINHQWEGYFIEAGRKCVASLKKDLGDFQNAHIIRKHVTTENINKVLPAAFDVLSIDIDGQDYWIWKAITARPKIAVIEYISSRPPGIMPLDNKFQWHKLSRVIGVDAALQIIGATEYEMVELGHSKGYRLVEKNDNNLFFLRRD